MKKIVALLILCIFCALGTVQAQSKYMNVPDTVCMSTTNSTADQSKFTSINAIMTGGNNYTYPANANWVIITPSGSAADYNILYSANTSTVKATKLTNTKSLTLEFLVPGTYTFKAALPYKINNGTTKWDTVTQKLVAVNCTINTCNGGYAVMAGFNEDFGTATARRPYPVTGVVQYPYQATGDLADEFYAISNTTFLRGDWIKFPDHTGNSNGAMMVVNSAAKPQRFYQKKVTGLCSGSVYNFSAWLININTQSVFENGCVSDYKYAGVTFQVVNAADTNQVLASFRTYAVSMMLPDASAKWLRYGGQFAIPAGVKDVLVRIINNKPGGCGNDLALDDISFTYCSPIITGGLLGNNTNLKEVLCEGSADTLTSSILPAGYFVHPIYQWEMSDNGGISWFNVPYGTPRDSLLKIPPGQLKGTKTVAAEYLFRVRVYDQGIPDSLGCANPSSPVKITILPMPTLSLTSSRVCAGSSVDLEASGGFDRFEWRDLPGYIGATRSITVLPPDTTVMVYGYVFYGEGGGKTCKDSNSAYIAADGKPIVEIAASTTSICLGEAVDFKINKALAGKDIRWYHGQHGSAIDTTLMPEWNGQTDIEVVPGFVGDSIFSVMVRSGVCTVESGPMRIYITETPPKIKFPTIINCSSIDSSGEFNLPDLTQPGVIGFWSVVSYTGIELQPDETIDDYVKIFNPSKMNTKVTIPFGSMVVIGWTAQPTANGTCKITSTDTLYLVNDPTYSYAGEDQTQCGTTNVFTLAATAPDITLTGPAAETGVWRIISGTPVIVDPTSPTTTVTVAGIQDAVLGWKITNAAGCGGNEDTIILHKTAPPTAVLKAPITICSAAGTFNVDTLSTTGAPIKYTLKAGTPALPGFVTMTDVLTWPIVVTYPTGTLPPPNTYNFILTVATDNPGCTTDIPFSLNISSPPLAPTGVTVGTPNICDTGSTILTVVGGNLGTKANGTPDAKWMWYKGACGGTPIDSGVSIAVHGIAATTTYYVRAEGTCGNTTCASGSVTVYTKPPTAATGLDLQHCNDSLFTMTANAASPGTGAWTIVSGTATITTSASPTSTIFVLAGNTATLRWTITNGVCSSNDDIVLANFKNIKAVAGPDQNHCNTPAFTLAGNSPGTGTGLWTIFSGTPTITTPGSQTSAVTVAAGDSAYLIWTITNGVCKTTDTVVLRNALTPSTSVAGPAQSHCSDSLFIMAANKPVVGKGLWTIVSGTAVIRTPTTDTTSVIVKAGSTATLMWTISNGACPPSTSTIVLTNYMKPDPAAAGLDLKHCNDSLFTMVANKATFGTGAWAILSGTASITTLSNEKTTVFVLAGNTATLRWTITNGACTTSDDIVLTNDKNIVAVAGPDQNHCTNAAFTLAANSAGTGTGVWTLTKGIATITTPASPISAVTVAAGDSAYLVWTIDNGACKTTDTVVLRNYQTPTPSVAGPAQAHCNDSLFIMAANKPTVGTGLWTIVSGTAVIRTPTADTTSVIVKAGSTATLQWTISNGVCTPSSTTIVLTNNQNIKAVAGPDQNHCNTPAFTLAGNSAGPGTGLWTIFSGTPVITTPGSPTSAVTVASGDSAYLVWTIDNGACKTTDTVVLRNSALPSTSVAGPAQSHCSDSLFIMAANKPTIGTGLWTIVSGTAVIRTPTADTTSVIVKAGSTATLQWTITNGTCPPSTSTIVLTNYMKPANAATGLDLSHCNDSLFTMVANKATFGTGLWTIVSGTATITTPSSEKTTVFVLAGNTATLRWTITNGACTTSDDIVLTNAQNIKAVAGPDQDHCTTPAFTLAGNSAGTGTGVWTLAKGIATITTPASPTSAVTVATGDSAYLVWTIDNGACKTTDTVVLRNYQTPTPSVAGPAQAHCNDSLFIMAANKPTVGTGLWTIVSGTAVIRTPTSDTSSVIVKAGSTATLQWTISNGVCTPSSTTIVLTNNQNIKALAGVDQGHCATPAFTLAGNSAGPGTGVWTLIQGTATITTPASPTSAVTVANGDSAYLVWTINNGACKTTDTVVLRNYQTPTPSVAGPAQQHCSDSLFIMAANKPTVGTGLWTIVSGTAVIRTPTADTTSVIVKAGSTATLQWTITNGTCPPSTSTIVLTNYMKPATAATGLDLSHCNDSLFTMVANKATFGTGLWTIVSGTATITTPASEKTTVFVLAGNTATLRWTITNGACTTSDDIVLTNAQNIKAVAGPDQDHCTTPAFTLAANSAGTGTGVWTLTKGIATITTPASPTSAVTVATGDSAYLVWTIDNGACKTTDTVVLRNYQTPTPSVAGPAQAHCNDSLFIMAANKPTVGTGLWTIVSGTAVIRTPTSDTSSVIVKAGSTATLQWTISNGVCTPSSTTIVLTNNQNIKALAGVDQGHCNTPAFTLAGNSAGPGTGAWTLINGTATITTPASPTSAVTVASGDSAYLVWTITNGACKTTDTVVLRNSALPSTSVAGPAQSHCNDSLFIMAANKPTVGTGLWTIVSGTAVIRTPTADTSSVIVKAGSTATLQWTITNGTCPPSTSTIVLTNYMKPATAATGLDLSHCNDSLFTMVANKATFGTGVWTIVSGTATITTPASEKTTVFVLAGSTATLRWTITNGACTTSDDIVLTNAQNIQAVAGPDQDHCTTPAFTLAGNGAGIWTLVKGTATITTPTSPTSAVTVATGDSAYLVWTIDNGACKTTDTVILRNYAAPTPSVAGPAQSHCNDSLFILAANKPTVGTGLWTIVSGTAVIRTPTSDTSSVIVKAGNTATLQWTISNGVCTPSSTTIVLTNNAPPTKAIAGPDQGGCLQSNFTLAANAPTLGTGIWTLVNGTGTITTPTSPTSAVTVANGDSAYLVWTITNGLCSSTDTVVIRNAVKAVNADAGIAQEHCGDPVFTLAGNTPDLPSAIGTWTVVSPASVTITDIHNPNATVNVPAGVTATLTWTIANLTCATSSNVTLTNFGPILGNTITADQTLCTTETPATLTGGVVSGGKGTYTYQWVMSTDSTNYTAIGGAFGTSYTPGVIAVTTWFRRVVASGACAPDTSKPVKLSLITKPPVVVTVPAAILTDCIQGKDYTTLFGTPTFSHEPYSNEALTVTSADVTTTVDACTTTIKRTWTATDRCGLTTSAQQTITVVDRTAPVFTTAAPANVTVNCDAVPAAINLTAKDDCAGMLTVVPLEMRQDMPGTCTSNYYLIRKWVVADACGNVSDTLRQTVTVKDLTPPVFNMTQPANITVDCDKVPAKTDLTATDNCTPGVITVTPVDSLATIPGNTCTQNYRIIRKWMATDNCGNTVVLRQTITVQDTSRPVFSIILPANITIDCDKVPLLPTVTATDNCTAVVTVTVGQKKEFLSKTCSNNYKLTRTWTAKDDCGNTTIMSQVILVQDTTRPTFTVIPPADTTISCDAIPAPATNLKAIDNCSASSNVKIAYTQTRQNITGACASNYQLIRTWTAKDECGNSTVIRQTITVVDTTKPVIDPAPADITVNCGESIQVAATLYARDNCDASFPKKATMKEDPYTKDLCAGYTIIRRWTIADACGNESIERVQTITVNPCPKPELDPTLPANCYNNTKFAILVNNKVNKAKFTLVDVTPAGVVTTPLTQNSNVFDLKGATQATFIVTDGVTGCVSDPVTYDLQYTTPPVVTLTTDTSICPNETVMLTVEPDGGTVRWLSGETTSSIVVSKPGDYWVTVTRDNCAVTDTVKVSEKAALKIELGPDRDLCLGGRTVVDGSNPDAISYLWNDGDTNPIKEITQPGKYIISVMDKFCSRITTDSVSVNITGIPAILLGNDTTLCKGQTLMLKVNAGTGNSVKWQDGATTPTYPVTQSGYYSVTVYNDCGTATDQIAVTFKECDDKPEFPNAFTPNGDGKNDTFKPIVNGTVYEFEMHVFNRWGQEIFISIDSQKGWDGKFAGKLVDNGTYVWLLSYKKTIAGEKIIAKGVINVLR
jgi:gliding motility-associated-like protein